VTGVGVGQFILQIDSGAHPASYSMGTEGFSLGVNRPGPLYPTQHRMVPMLGMSGAVLPVPQYALMEWKGTNLLLPFSDGSSFRARNQVAGPTVRNPARVVLLLWRQACTAPFITLSSNVWSVVLFIETYFGPYWTVLCGVMQKGTDFQRNLLPPSSV